MAAETFLHAVRILSVDIANLSSTNAVFRAHIEEMQQVAEKIDTRSWEHRKVGEGENTTVEIMLPVDQEVLLNQLLGLVEGLR